MKLSFEGIGQWAATFACEQVREGEPVKISGNGQVAACGSGDPFCGMAVSVSRDGDACAVALGGMVTAGYSGSTAPTLGRCGLAADGSGGVQVSADGHSYLVAEVDSAAKTITFVL
jgi:hypothetical protein